MVVLTVKLVALTLSVTWGLTKTILFGVGLPVILAVLFIAGLTAFAVPLLILALLGVFLLPLFGICLGHQLMALAQGFDTYKLKYGHRGINHPVKDLEANRVYITSQNHGFVVNADTVDPTVADVSFVSMNDGSVEGLRYKNGRVFTVQFHPEASSGPLDTGFLFDKFIDLMGGSRI